MLERCSTPSILQLRPDVLGSLQIDKPGTIAALLKETKPDDLNQLELLLEKEIVTIKEVIGHLIFDWSRYEGDEIQHRTTLSSPRQTFIQVESLRDGDQIAASGVSRLSNRLDVARQVFRSLPVLGVQVADLGMPISGQREQDKILSMIRFLAEENIPIAPAVAGRTHPDDVAAIIELANYAYRAYGIKTVVYAFVGSSRIRMLTQGQNKWNIPTISEWTANTVSALKRAPGVGSVIVPFEDTYGSHPDDIQVLFRSALESGADGICICDTCSRGINSDWTINLIRYIGHHFCSQYPEALWEIHTHNMMVQAVANAITACREGIISGVHATLGGVGDLGGNMPLEHFVVQAVMNDLIPSGKVNLAAMNQLVNMTLAARNISPSANPFQGGIYSESARKVASGIHARAFQDLDKVGPFMRNVYTLVYFPVDPKSLGLDFGLDIVTPVSGASNVIALATRLGVTEYLTDIITNAILNLAKEKGSPLTNAEFLSCFPN